MSGTGWIQNPSHQVDWDLGVVGFSAWVSVLSIHVVNQILVCGSQIRSHCLQAGL